MAPSRILIAADVTIEGKIGARATSRIAGRFKWRDVNVEGNVTVENAVRTSTGAVLRANTRGRERSRCMTTSMRPPRVEAARGRRRPTVTIKARHTLCRRSRFGGCAVRRRLRLEGRGRRRVARPAHVSAQPRRARHAGSDAVLPALQGDHPRKLGDLSAVPASPEVRCGAAPGEPPGHLARSRDGAIRSPDRQGGG